MPIKTARSGRILGAITGALLALAVLVAAPDARAADEPSIVSAAPVPAAGAMAIQGGLSGLSTTVEGEVAASWGLVLGIGLHMTPDDEIAPTARLAFDHAFGQTRHHHLRAGIRLYGFSENPMSATCASCTLLVPEIGYRFTSEGGFVFEIGEPVGRLNLSRVGADGLAHSFASDGANGFLVTMLVGYSHPL